MLKPLRLRNKRVIQMIRHNAEQSGERAFPFSDFRLLLERKSVVPDDGGVHALGMTLESRREEGARERAVVSRTIFKVGMSLYGQALLS